MRFDYNVWLSSALAAAPDPMDLWLSGVISETGVYRSSFEYRDSMILDQRGVLSSSLTIAPGVGGDGETLSIVDPLDSVLRESRSISIPIGARFSQLYTLRDAYIHTDREISDSGYHLPEYALGGTHTELNIYANGRRLKRATDAVKSVYNADYSVRRNQNAATITFDQRGLAPGRHLVAESRYVGRRHWTFYTELADVANRQFPFQISIDWDGWVQDILDWPDLWRNIHSRCALWIVVQRDDVELPLVHLLRPQDWQVNSVDTGTGKVYITVHQSHNFTFDDDFIGFSEVSDISTDRGLRVGDGVRVWYVLVDALQSLEFNSQVRENGKEISINIQNIDLDYLPSFERTRVENEIQRAGDCRFTPPPVRQLHELHVFGHVLSADNYATDVRRLCYSEDYRSFGTSVVYFRGNLMPIMYADGACLYLREPVSNRPWVTIQCETPQSSEPTYDPANNWQDWSKRIYSIENPPVTVNGKSYTPLPSTFPMAVRDNRYSATAWIGGLHRELVPTPDDHGGIGKVTVDDDLGLWMRYGNDRCVYTNGSVPWVQQTLIANQPPAWPTWQAVIDNGAIDVFYEIIGTSPDYFDDDVVINGENTRAWNVLFVDNTEVANVSLSFNPVKSGSAIATIDALVFLFSPDYYNRAAVEIYVSIDHNAWTLVKRQVLADYYTVVSHEYELSGSRIRARAVVTYLPVARRVPENDINDTVEQLLLPNTLLSRDYMQSFSQIIYWNRSTQYELSADITRQIDESDPRYTRSPLEDVLLIAWNRLTTANVRALMSPNNPANGDYVFGAPLGLLVKDYHSHADELDASPGDGPLTLSTIDAPILLFLYPDGVPLSTASIDLTPNYTTTLRWAVVKPQPYDLWTRTFNADYDYTQTWKLCRYITVDPDNLPDINCGTPDDTRYGMIDDGYLYSWGGEIYADWTYFAIDDGELVEGSNVSVDTAFPIMDSGTAPRYLQGDN
jgi:hypothetical protein